MSAGTAYPAKRISVPWTNSSAGTGTTLSIFLIKSKTRSVIQFSSIKTLAAQFQEHCRRFETRDSVGSVNERRMTWQLDFNELL